jgi:hypothetical protein
MRSGLVLCAFLVIAAPVSAAAQAQPPGEQAAAQVQQADVPAGYVWSAACKECHEDVYAAWEKTKHARALNRLSASDQQKECIRCHVTGAKTLVRVNDKPVNAGIQCESCHGPGEQHIAGARAGNPTPLGRKPGPDMCVDCHSKESPHFRGFIYNAMAKLVHRTS